jgi:hypothetical protein
MSSAHTVASPCVLGYLSIIRLNDVSVITVGFGLISDLKDFIYTSVIGRSLSLITRCTLKIRVRG